MVEAMTEAVRSKARPFFGICVGMQLMATRGKEHVTTDGFNWIAGDVEKISPREIDEVLLTHPAIAEAVCFGVPHGTWGEEVAAAVVLREAATACEADLLAFCKERLADFKRPKQIHITQTIPRTATGKIQRGVVAKAYIQNAT